MTPKPSVSSGHRPNRKYLKAGHWLATMACLVCQGCSGGNWQSATYPAQGQISINGEPPAGAVVELHAAGEKPDSRNSRPWAVVQDDGSYRLTTYTTGDGAPPGQYAVTVRWPPDVTQPSFADRLGGAYAVVERSKWNVTIAEAENVLPPIEIDANVQSKEAASASGKAPRPTMNGVPL